MRRQRREHARRELPRTAAILLSLLAAGADEPIDRAEPRRSELVERTESRLAQIDVSVSGPAEIIGDLGPADFRLKINLTRIHEFDVDRYCSVDPHPTDQAATGLLTSPTRKVSYLFYFDQPHLTLSGRQRALDLSRELIPLLVRDGSLGMIVSDARRLAVIEELTSDPEALLQAVGRLENDREQWDSFATEEAGRVGAVIKALNDDDDVNRAVSIARSHQRDERFRSDKSLRRLELTLIRLDQVDTQKVVVYFADTMRSNAGEHFLNFFGDALINSRAELAEMALDGLAAALPYDRVVNTATARGIRFYPIQARGLVTPFDHDKPDSAATTRTGAVSSSSRVRIGDAENTLANLARETGGRAFLTGWGADKMARSILVDHACTYTISFDPTGFAVDVPLRAVVEVTRDGVTARTPGRVVVESESTRLASRLLSAFSTGRSEDAAPGLQANLVPIGFRGGAYSALLQVSIPGTELPGAKWELGASTYSRDKVLQEVSGSLSVGRQGVPMILEREIELPPGPHEIAAVARETTTDFILSEQFQVSWPDPDIRPVTCGPIALLQPLTGAFLREGETRTSGSFALSESEPLRSERPTALTSLVCRNRRHKTSLVVERSLIGQSAVWFPELQFELSAERCAQIRDVIPARSLGPGFYRYVVRVKQDGEPLHEMTRGFQAVDGP